MWELPVQYVMNDCVKEGDCVLDVGANIGALSVAFSRLVGAKGEVHSFEANPFLLRWLRAQLYFNGAHNVTLVPRAVSDRSDQHVTFYCEQSPYATGSGLTDPGPGSKQVTVTTVCLDDYCSKLKLQPSAIKIDVEGAEHLVLRGASHTIEQFRPAIVFEYCADRAEVDDPILCLEPRNYRFFDANLYLEVSRQFYLEHFDVPPIVNVLAVPAEKTAELGFGEIDRGVVCEPAEREGIQLDPGRYVLEVDIQGDSQSVAGVSVLTEFDELLIYFEANIATLRSPASSDLVFELDEVRTIRYELKQISGEAAPGPATLFRITRQLAPVAVAERI